jgi:hypothetical protein
MTADELQQAIKQREADIAHYQVNIDNYTSMIGMLPKFWPADLAQYRNTPPVDLVEVLPFDLIQLVSDLQFKEKLERTLVTERLEQRKSMFVLKALQQKL